MGESVLGLTRRAMFAGCAGAALNARMSQAASSKPVTAADQYRPQIHFAPQSGFMNDPNGLIYRDSEYHLFYQYNPFASTWGHMHWGHAVSPDLLHWTTLPPALGETNAGMAFSGSAVWDGGIAVIYTRASTSKQAQEIAFSKDGGRTFQEYPGNPVLDIGSNSFRDPKVVRYKPGGYWVMAVARAEERKVAFYRSEDLRKWTELSSFGPSGMLGGNYECPNLVEIPVEGGGSKYVLFVSINPGAPLGGSAVEYFVGDFDGTRFTPDDGVTRLVDFAKDFYAMQVFSDSPGPGPLAMAWLSNWQYANETPTGPWRGVMTLPRRLRLRRGKDDWRLLQELTPLDSSGVRVLFSGEPKDSAVSIPAGDAIEVRLHLNTRNSAVTTLRFLNDRSEHLNIGYDAGRAELFVDRSGTHGFDHRFFTGKFSAYVDGAEAVIDLQIVFDRCTLEVLAQKGEVCGSLLHFFQNAPSKLSVTSTGAAAGMNLTVRSLA